MTGVQRDDQETYELMTFSLEWGLIYTILLTVIWVCRVRKTYVILFTY